MRKVLIIACFTLGSTGALVAPAHASHWYGVGVISHTSVQMHRRGPDATLSADGASGLSSKDTGSNTLKWRLQLGYQFNRYLSVEGGYIDLGHSTYRAISEQGQTRAKWTSGGPDIAVLGNLPINPELSLFGKLGAIDTRTRMRWNQASDTLGTLKTHSGRGMHAFAGIGMDYRLSPRWGLRAEYEHFSGLGSLHTAKASANVVSAGVTLHF
ncbi:outer membrane beta-barrel protein [Oleiagrimonas sp. C23AA]|uniref:outer membrane beta-barrel protein n=1 Tax=Oleiagrimonas sp. C23AA TaxID=2719047 RepID=UPI001424619C|nr:outer membrane beta-barrel protein [Oleiagrimonas sp. C23AA]NII10563.1 outer membrane beta-barrel protein [Oleiagrimonas sp. C23AA]